MKGNNMQLPAFHNDPHMDKHAQNLPILDYKSETKKT